MALARVFPRRTKATPTDKLVFTDGPGVFLPEIDEVHVSVTFSWDTARAEQLAREWERVAPVKIGGPAIGTRGEDFEPGVYLRHGYVITSRGCPRRCWFCNVWRRDGAVRELPIRDGWNVQDDNLLACSEEHVRAVFAMLKRQKQRAWFTGGLDARLLQDWHIDLLWDLKPKQMFFAYDTPGDYEPLVEAGKRLYAAGWTFAGHRLRAYVLIGHPRDTLADAERRLRQTVDAGFMPMAMLWGDGREPPSQEWRRLQRTWARPAATARAIEGRPEPEPAYPILQALYGTEKP
jgi:hypothetical protein